MNIVTFCNNCSVEWEQPLGLNVKEIFDGLKENNFKRCHCAGCGMMAIANQAGKLKVTYTKKMGTFVEYNFKYNES